MLGNERKVFVIAIPSPNDPISCCTKFLINPPQICSLLKGLVNNIRFGHFRKHF
jgi:hypothetical protein